MWTEPAIVQVGFSLQSTYYGNMSYQKEKEKPKYPLKLVSQMKWTYKCAIDAINDLD